MVEALGGEDELDALAEELVELKARRGDPDPDERVFGTAGSPPCGERLRPP